MVVVEPNLVGGGTVVALRALLALRQHHIAAIGQEDGITADAQHLVGILLGDVTGIIVKNADGHIGVFNQRIQMRDVAHMFGIEGVRHAHQLLHPFDGVVVAPFGIHFGFQEKGAHAPRDGGKFACHHGAGTHLQGHQTVGVGRHPMGFNIHRRALRGAGQYGNLHGNRMFCYQHIVGIAHHRLVTHLLRGLCKDRRHGNHQDCKKSK